MTPGPDSQQGDPVAVILARMEVKLDNALTEQARHATTLDRHDTRLRSVEDRTTALEASKPKNVAVWAANVIAALAVIAAFAALFINR